MTTVSHTESTRGELGQGLYGLGELRLYVAYEGEPDDAPRVLDWLSHALNPVPHARRQADYSFSDLISLFVVRELVRRGVQPHRIRAAERHLRQRWNTDRPFVSDRISTDGQHVYTDEGLAGDQPEAVEAASLQGQHVMVEPIRDYLTSVRYHHGEAFQWAPADRVVLDPRVQFGEPVIAGTRVLTADVYAIAGAYGVATAARRLAVDEDAVESALEFEHRVEQLRS